jgi:NAD(P)H-dependent FMN reductase
MKKLLIISSTRNSNFDLSQDIKSYFDNKEDISCSVISLEEFDLPLYRPELEEKFKESSSFPEDIDKVKSFIVKSDALIWCSPEYNGGVSPILTNMIAWISRATDDWREGFKDKHSLVCSSSGGNGKHFIEGFSLQLSYLGSKVMDKSIIKTKKSDINKSDFEGILGDFYHSFNKV